MTTDVASLIASLTLIFIGAFFALVALDLKRQLKQSIAIREQKMAEFKASVSRKLRIYKGGKA